MCVFKASDDASCLHLNEEYCARVRASVYVQICICIMLHAVLAVGLLMCEHRIGNNANLCMYSCEYMLRECIALRWLCGRRCCCFAAAACGLLCMRTRNSKNMRIGRVVVVAHHRTTSSSRHDHGNSLLSHTEFFCVCMYLWILHKHTIDAVMRNVDDDNDDMML